MSHNQLWSLSIAIQNLLTKKAKKVLSQLVGHKSCKKYNRLKKSKMKIGKKASQQKRKKVKKSQNWTKGENWWKKKAISDYFFTCLAYFVN